MFQFFSFSLSPCLLCWIFWVFTSWCLSFLIIFPLFLLFSFNIFLEYFVVGIVFVVFILIACLSYVGSWDSFLTFFWVSFGKKGFIIAFTGTTHRWYNSGASQKEIKVIGDDSTRVLWVYQVRPDLTRTLHLFCQHTRHIIQYWFGYCDSRIFMLLGIPMGTGCLIKVTHGRISSINVHTTRIVMPYQDLDTKSVCAYFM